MKTYGPPHTSRPGLSAEMVAAMGLAQLMLPKQVVITIIIEIRIKIIIPIVTVILRNNKNNSNHDSINRKIVLIGIIVMIVL